MYFSQYNEAILVLLCFSIHTGKGKKEGGGGRKRSRIKIRKLTVSQETKGN